MSSGSVAVPGTRRPNRCFLWLNVASPVATVEASINTSLFVYARHNDIICAQPILYNTWMRSRNTHLVLDKKHT